MPTDSDFKPAVEGKNAALLEAALVKRVPYVFAEGENIQDWVSTEDGTTTLAILNSDTRAIFWLDPDDTTSVHDGVSVCVSSDGKRYHATDFRWPTSILAVGEETPPADSPGPETGDTYQIGAAPTGDWSSNAGDIAIYTSRGWVFLTPPEGLLFYNQDDGRFYYQDENGDFGQITVAVAAGTVTPESLIGGKRFYVVENQTTNSPPGSPSLGVFWIVGSSPTGAWSGQTGNLARSDDGTNWIFITPTEGDHAYDKAENALFRYDGTWINAAGAYVTAVSAAANASASITGDGTGASGTAAGYNYSDTTAPTSTADHRGDESLTLTHTATASGKILEIQYTGRLSFTGDPGTQNISSAILTVGLFRDSDSSAVDWQKLASFGSGSLDTDTLVNVTFRVAAGDASEHTWRVRFFLRLNLTGTSASNSTFTAARRRMFLRELA